MRCFTLILALITSFSGGDTSNRGGRAYASHVSLLDLRRLPPGLQDDDLFSRQLTVGRLRGA